jgi:hypothetical protein
MVGHKGTYAVYMNSTLVSAILSLCSKGKSMLVCRPVGNSLLTVAAMSLRADVLHNCSISSSCTNVANGVGWYHSDIYKKSVLSLEMQVGIFSK